MDTDEIAAMNGVLQRMAARARTNMAEQMRRAVKLLAVASLLGALIGGLIAGAIAAAVLR
jgi:predicted lipid-binding transport protein (Tim44 family)